MTTAPRFTGGTSVLLGLLIALVVIAAIWLPEFDMWYVDPVKPTSKLVQMSKVQPDLETLIEIARMDLSPPSPPIGHGEVIRRAESLTAGTLSVPGLPDQKVSAVFSQADLRQGSLKWQLIAASLAGVEQLLDAYQLTGREDFFHLAEKNVLAFAQFESSRWMDTGFLWNDHAIAARIPVLVKFWALYRQRPDFDEITARTILYLVARSGMLLAKPEHYAWRTGHGIVQNLALLQIAVAFPHLAESAYFRDTAQRRLAAHLPYYINREGVTLLHSAGYAAGGIRYLGMAMRLYSIAGTPIPPEWWDRYKRAEDFDSLLRRPDGSLPMFGDTTSDVDSYGPRRTSPDATGRATPLSTHRQFIHRPGAGVYPEAGYAVWWQPRTQLDGETESQTVAVWSNYPGLGHKHADEMSVLIWAAGRTWLTNVGYWPYGLPGRKEAESWEGSNAPHLYNEPSSSRRTARLISTGNNENLHFIEMQRHGPDGFSARREVLQFGPGKWLVLDRFNDTNPRKAVTRWTFYPDLNVEQGRAPGSFNILDPGSTRTMACSFQSSQDGKVEHISGRTAPFSGWVVIGSTPTAAPALAVHSNTKQGLQLAVCVLQDRADAGNTGDVSAVLSGVEGEDDWTVNVATTANAPELILRRSGSRIIVTEAGVSRGRQTLELSDVADPREGVARVLSAFQTSTDQSERRVSLVPYRARVTYLLVVVLLAQELTLLALRRRVPRMAGGLRVVSAVAWIGAGIWLMNSYFIVG